jgi:hypothetical protein
MTIDVNFKINVKFRTYEAVSIVSYYLLLKLNAQM